MKKSLLAASLALGLLCSSCLGPNKMFNAMNEWNDEVTDNRWANETIFVFLSPVHLLAWCFDITIGNSILWWQED